MSPFWYNVAAVLLAALVFTIVVAIVAPLMRRQMVHALFNTRCLNCRRLLDEHTCEPARLRVQVDEQFAYLKRRHAADLPMLIALGDPTDIAADAMCRIESELDHWQETTAPALWATSASRSLLTAHELCFRIVRTPILHPLSRPERELARKMDQAPL